MKEMFDSFYLFLTNCLSNAGVWAPVFASLLIVFESILPILPLFVFITINFVSFGIIWGFIISWICTVLGCILAYFLVKKYFRTLIIKKIHNINLLTKCMNYIENMSITNIMLILAIPFTPAFMMNIAAGLVNMNFKKFVISIFFSKIFLVYFWGFVGTSLLDSLKNPSSLVTVFIMLVVAYFISIVIKKIFKLT